jgi:hypothetical protein
MFWFCRANRWSTFWYISPQFEFNERRCYRRLFMCWATKALSQKLREKFEAVSLNIVTVQRGVGDINKDAEIQFSDIFNKYVYYSLVVDESTVSNSTAQMPTFARHVTLILKCLWKLQISVRCKDKHRCRISCEPYRVALRSIIWMCLSFRACQILHLVYD